jgi:HEAT repeat protein
VGGGAAIPALTEAARGDEHFAVRAAAATALGRIGDAQAVQPLLATIHDQDPYVRTEATAALARFHTTAALPAFRDALRSDDVIDRLSAVRAYADVMRLPNASPTLVDLVLERLGDEDAAVADTARVGLRTLAHERAVPAAITALSHDASAVRLGAAELLSERTDARAVEPLVNLLLKVDEPTNVHNAVRKAVGANVEYFDLPAQRAAATNPTHPDRIKATRVLAALGDASAIECVQSALVDGDASVRIAAARAASDLGTDRGRTLLTAAGAKEADPRVKRQLELLLKSMQ